MIQIKDQNGQKAIDLCRTIQGHGKEAWLVGGAIRDLLMGREPHDYDICTNSTTLQIMRWFPKVIPTGIKHGTVTVVEDQHSYEVTTYRGESGYSNGRHPDMTYSVHTIEEDLSRRDFTVNAVAYDPISDRFCDPFGGGADILLRRIKTVGSPMERFAEDGLRCLRACRFAATLDFTIGFETFDAIGQNLDTFQKVSVERVVAEWKKAFKATDPSIAFRLMANSGLLGITVPEFIPSYNMKQNKYHAYDIFNHTLMVLKSAPKNELVQLAALFHDVAKAYTVGTHPVTGQRTFYDHEEQGAIMTKDIMTRLKFSTEEIEKVSTLVRHHLLPRNDLSNAALRRWVRRVGAENVDELLDLAQADLEGKGPAEEKIPDDFVFNFRDRLSKLGEVGQIVSKTNQLTINGNDVMGALGIKPGRGVGLVLDKLLEYVTDSPEMNTRSDLFAYLNQMGYSTQP